MPEKVIDFRKVTFGGLPDAEPYTVTVTLKPREAMVAIEALRAYCEALGSLVCDEAARRETVYEKVRQAAEAAAHAWWDTARGR